MANKGLILIMVIGLIVLLVFSGTIIATATTLFAEMNSAIAGLFGDLGNGLGYNTTSPTPSPSSSPTPTPTGGGNPTPTPTSGEATHGAVWFAFTLHFSDGTSQDLNMNAPESPMFSLFPMSITYMGKTVSSMDVLIRLKLTGDGLGLWGTTSSQHIEIYFNGASTPATSSTGSFSDSGSSWTSGETQTINTVTISGTTLNTLFATYGYGSWVFQTTGVATVTINGQQYSATMVQNDITLQNSNTLSVASLTATHLTTFPLTRTR